MPRPIVLLHGYSNDADTLQPWRAALMERGYEAADIRVGDYVSTSNEVTIRDIAEGFDRALREQAGLDEDAEFDALVHSTGSLVIRDWITSYEGRRRRLKHLIGLAPANFGSPLAHRGRSILGAVLIGRKNAPFGGDFLEPGDKVLAALELASPYTWELAHRDLLTPDSADEDYKPIYSASPDTPYPFVFIGTKPYRFVDLVIHEHGYDGVVRWAGAALDARKLVIDLTRAAPATRVGEQPRRAALDIPLAFAKGLDHSTIMAKPEHLIDAVVAALDVDSRESYAAWKAKHARPVTPRPERWQQFVIRVVDERGDPVPDYFVALGTGTGDDFEPLEDFSTDVHRNREDPSLRCFHVDLEELEGIEAPLQLRLLASAGTRYVGYFGVNPGASPAPDARPVTWNARLDLALPADIDFFYAHTTTLIEIRLNREPTPPFDPSAPTAPMGLITLS